MKPNLKLIGLVLLLGISETAVVNVANAQSQDRNGIIQDALRRGAHIVQCENDKCQDQTTMKFVDHDDKAQDGVYLVYPNTPDASTNIDRTREAVKAIQ